MIVEINCRFAVILETANMLPATCNKDYGFTVPIPKFPLEVNIIVGVKLLDVSASPKRIPPAPCYPF